MNKHWKKAQEDKARREKSRDLLEVVLADLRPDRRRSVVSHVTQAIQARSIVVATTVKKF